MVDVQALVKAIPDYAALLLVGDIDQLPRLDPEALRLDCIRDIPVLCPMNRGGALSWRIGLRSGRWPNNRADGENQLRRIPVPARDYSPDGPRDARASSAIWPTARLQLSIRSLAQLRCRP